MKEELSSEDTIVNFVPEVQLVSRDDFVAEVNVQLILSTLAQFSNSHTLLSFLGLVVRAGGSLEKNFPSKTGAVVLTRWDIIIICLL